MTTQAEALAAAILACNWIAAQGAPPSSPPPPVPTWTSVATGAFPMMPRMGFGSIWVPCVDDATVRRHDPLTGAITATIACGAVGANYPHAIASSPQAGAWFTDAKSSQARRIDPATNQITATINLPALPRGVCVSGQYVWVAVCGNDTVVKIDATALPPAIVQTVSVGYAPWSWMAGDDQYLWVPCLNANRVYRVELATGATLGIITQGASPCATLVDLPNDAVWASNYGAPGFPASVTRIKRSTGEFVAQHYIESGAGSHDMVRVGSDELWITESSLNRVCVLNITTGAIKRTYNTATDPAGQCLSLDGDSAVITACAMGNVLERRAM